MGENEQSEMIHYTLFFIIIMILTVLLFGFIQVSQVQTVQHNTEATLSKNGGYTTAAITQLTGNANSVNSSNDLLPLSSSGWIYLSKAAAQNSTSWSDLNNGDPVTTAGNNTHWGLDANTVEQQNTLIPYQIVVKPLGSGGGAGGIILGWIPQMSFNGVAQSQVYTGSVQ